MRCLRATARQRAVDGGQASGVSGQVVQLPESCKLGRWAERASTHQNHASWEGGQSGQQLTRIMQVGKVGRVGSNSPESCKLGRWAERQVWALSQVEPSDAPALPSSLLNKFHRSEKAISHITLLSVLPTLPTFPTCMISGELDWGGAGAALYLTLHC